MLYQYNDGLREGSRRPRLWFARGGEVRKFEGTNIPDWVVIIRNIFEKKGKWSNTTYDLELAPGVRPLYLISPLHGIWGERYASWGELASDLQLPIEVAKQIVQAEYPRTAERLNNIESWFNKQESVGGKGEIVVISFGSPTNRMIAEGFWKTQKIARTSDGRFVTVRQKEVDDSPLGWRKENVIAYVEEGQEATVVSVARTPGHHGGYVTIEVCVPDINVS